MVSASWTVAQAILCGFFVGVQSAFSFLAFADMGEPEDHSAKSPL